MHSDSRQFRAQLLDRTLHYAADNVPFYRNLPNLREKGSSLCLEDFPILTKEQIAANLWEFLVLDRFPDYIISSGGTTGGAPNISFRNEEEYQAAQHYLTGLSPGEIPALDSIEEFVIDIFFNTNGYSWRKAPGWPILSLRLEQPNHAEVIKSLIRKGLVIGGRQIPARRIQSQNGTLRALTGYFWVKEFFPRDYGIKSVYGYGSHISKVWRERLRELWGAEILTSYGLSEFAVGNAMQCNHCGSYHYWTAWPEFLALDRSGPVEKGDAVLVLTSLVPFTHVQPRIRYCTEDLVTLTGRCEAADQMGFRFRGRAASSAVALDGGNYEVLLSEVEVIEALDRLPGISCHAHYFEQQAWADADLPRPPFPMGSPRFRINPAPVAEGPKKIEILVETSFDTALERARAEKLRQKFVETLFAEFPRLPDRLSAFETTIVVELLPPGALKLRIKATA